jgi:hypothetical protein
LQAVQKDSEAYEGNGVLEYGNIGVLGFKHINPSFHPSTIQSLLRWSEAIERNEAYESFSAAR